MIDKTSYAYRAISGIKTPETKLYNDDKEIDTSLIEFADKKADGQKNKTGITVMLEDFATYGENFHGKSYMNINDDDVKPSFGNKLARLFGMQSKKTIYTSDEAQEYIKNNGAISINDIYEMANAKDGGIKYANDGDNYYDAALNFSNAAIGAIEKSYSKVHDSGGKKDGKLNFSELKHLNISSEMLEKMDLDGDTSTLSAEEYASYLVATDGFVENDLALYNTHFSSSHVDGIISPENADLAKYLGNEQFKEYAKQVYNEHYNKD